MTIETIALVALIWAICRERPEPEPEPKPEPEPEPVAQEPPPKVVWNTLEENQEIHKKYLANGGKVGPLSIWR